MKVATRPGRQGAGPDQDASSPSAERPRREGALVLMAVALLLLVGFLQLSPSLSGRITSEISNLLSTTERSTTSNSTSPIFSVYSPLIANGAANVSYPAYYSELARYTLALINQDRANFSLPPVSLGDSKAGQQHANSMLKYGYFSHYDTQGFKPYMRYTLLGGLGAVSENVAYITWVGKHFTTAATVENSISTLEHAMVYNDSLCCSNGHRLNIINPLHNRVSVGFGYNDTTLYFVEEFENHYVNLSFTISKSYSVTMAGPVIFPFASVNAIYVTHDPAPVPETAAQLNAGPKEYDPGTLAGGVLPPCSQGCTVFASGVTVRAAAWVVNSAQVDISFDLTRFIQAYGAGVYTVYMVTGADTSTALTSISVFVS
ncbi:MAG: CAP domain-containing protein [Nitrososphaerales archaeon]|nr:CAP domain-containing protein [Nitrososphaerales archaeon]